MSILSIQSRVSYGYVGNSVAIPAIQAAGLDAWTLDTVSFSNHPGHGKFSGALRDPDALAEELDGMAALGILQELDAVLSGYLGMPETGEVIANAVDRARAARPECLYVLDPVIGDDGRSFVREGVADVIRERLFPRADLITPNIFELGELAGGPVPDGTREIIEAARTLIHGDRLRAVAVTGIVRQSSIASLLVQADDCYETETPRQSRQFNGTGDLFAALITAWLVRSGDMLSAFTRAAGGLELATRLTAHDGRRELALPAILSGLKSLCPSPFSRIC